MGYTFGYAGIGKGEWIDDARVYVVGNEADTIVLDHDRKGVYRNSYRKPERGVSYRHTEAFFQQQHCFTGSPFFENFSNENYTLLGQIPGSGSFKVYLWNFLEGEYRLQFRNLSDEAYQYHKNYVEQLASRMDNSTIMNPAYSNMSNRVGIFAGYSEEVVRVR